MSPVIAGRKSARWKNSARRCWWKKESWKRIRGELLTQSTIHADETVMQMHKEKDRPDTLGLRMGVYSSAKRAAFSCAASNIGRAEAENGRGISLRASAAS